MIILFVFNFEQITKIVPVGNKISGTFLVYAMYDTKNTNCI